MQTLGPIPSKIRQWVWVKPENLHIEYTPQGILIKVRATLGERVDRDRGSEDISPETFQIRENQMGWDRWSLWVSSRGYH